jgi:hypothetical protein
MMHRREPSPRHGLAVLAGPLACGAGTAAQAATAPAAPRATTASPYLYGVSAASATSAWAVGTTQTGAYTSQSLTIHWGRSILN